MEDKKYEHEETEAMEQEETAETNGYLLPDKAYGILKWTGLIACPALAVFIQAVGPAWGMPCTEQIVLTLNSLGVLIGALIGISQAKGGDR